MSWMNEAMSRVDMSCEQFSQRVAYPFSDGFIWWIFTGPETVKSIQYFTRKKTQNLQKSQENIIFV